MCLIRIHHHCRNKTMYLQNINFGRRKHTCNLKWFHRHSQTHTHKHIHTYTKLKNSKKACKKWRKSADGVWDSKFWLNETWHSKSLERRKSSWGALGHGDRQTAEAEALNQYGSRRALFGLALQQAFRVPFRKPELHLTRLQTNKDLMKLQTVRACFP